MIGVMRSVAKSRLDKKRFSAQFARRSVIAIAGDRTQAERRFEVSCALLVVPVRPAHNNVDDRLKLVKHQIRERRRKICRDGASNDEDR